MKTKKQTSQYHKLFSDDSAEILKNCNEAFDLSISGLEERLNFLDYCKDKLKPPSTNTDSKSPDFKVIVGERDFLKIFLDLIMSGKARFEDYDRLSLEEISIEHWIDDPYTRLIERMEMKFHESESELQTLYLSRAYTLLDAYLGNMPEFEQELSDLRAEIDARENPKTYVFQPKKKIKWKKHLQELAQLCISLANTQGTPYEEQFRRATMIYLVPKKSSPSSANLDQSWVPVNMKQLTNARDRINSKSTKKNLR